MNQKSRVWNTPLWKLPKKQQRLLSLLISILYMTTATILSLLYFHFVDNPANVSMVYILALVLVSHSTSSYWYGIICSLFAVICVNYLFTYPYMEINFTITGYPVTFIGMLAITLLTSTTTSHLVRQSELIAEREKLLVEVEKEKMRANLLRAISHDLRTPLTGILGNSSVYLENSDQLSDIEKKEIVTNIYNDSNWLLNMVENLLSVTRIKGDNLSINTSLEPVEEVLSEALQKLLKRYPKAQITVTIPDEMILLPMDAILIEQVIINLLENAIVHSSSFRPLELHVAEHPTEVSFSIKDYGVGLPENHLEDLFDGAVSVSSGSSDARKGMGIGLSICKTIITAHHGTLTGHNHKEGAEMIFTLPKPGSFNTTPSTGQVTADNTKEK